MKQSTSSTLKPERKKYVRKGEFTGGRKPENKENMVLTINKEIKAKANKYFPYKVSGMVQAFLQEKINKYEALTEKDNVVISKKGNF